MGTKSILKYDIDPYDKKFKYFLDLKAMQIFVNISTWIRLDNKKFLSNLDRFLLNLIYKIHLKI